MTDRTDLPPEIQVAMARLDNLERDAERRKNGTDLLKVISVFFWFGTFGLTGWAMQTWRIASTYDSTLPVYDHMSAYERAVVDAVGSGLQIEAGGLVVGAIVSAVIGYWIWPKDTADTLPEDPASAPYAGHTKN